MDKSNLFSPTVSNESFDTFRLATTSLLTNEADKIFQLTAKAIEFSDFVTRTVNSQPNALPEPINWHLNHLSSEFYDDLVIQINNTLMSGSASILQENVLAIEDFKSHFQTEALMMKFLRQIRYQHSCAIAILELNQQIAIEESIKRMSILAEVLIKLAYTWSYAKISPRSGLPVYTSNSNNKVSQNMMILAMGKFGGYELNFSSDVDLIFFFGEDGQTIGARRAIDNSRFFQKLGVLVIKLLDEITEDGFVFRIDMRLRPFGDSGALTMSLKQAEDYYQEQGRDWERFAMVRSRVITGRLSEIEKLENIIRPFSFRRYIDYGIIDSLRNMKEMIQREVRRRDLKNNIKLGSGGIREIEFMVQSLQLIQGGRNKVLQEKSILNVLPLLVENNLLDKAAASELAENYRYLRRLENYIQQMDEKHTQELPCDELTQQKLATITGNKDYKSLKSKIEKIQLKTSTYFTEIFSEQVEQAEDENDDFYISLWEGIIQPDGLEEYFSQSEAIDFLEAIDKFRRSQAKKSLSSKGSKRLNAIMPLILERVLSMDIRSEIIDDRNIYLESFSRIIKILKSILNRTAYLDLLAENQPILKHLVDLVSRSEWVADRLAEHPILMDELLYPNSLYQPLKRQDLENELRQSLLRIEVDDEEVLLDAIRQFKQINELRVASALIIAQLNIEEVGNYLTQLAEVIIDIGVKQCWKTIEKKHGVPEGLQSSEEYGFAIIGYGKLGGLELGFQSDLDLVFLFDQGLDTKTNGIKPISVTRFYTRLSQKLIHFLSTRTHQGVLYEVDMRLRPSGNSGMLVSHIDTFKSYQSEDAWTWEHQALIRARVVFSGAENLTNQFNDIRHKVLIKERGEKLKIDVSKMRKRMRRQLDKSKADKFDLKQGAGGLVDIEFLVQYFTLSNKPIFEIVAPSNTVKLISYLAKNKLISMETQGLLLLAYNHFRNVINVRALNNLSHVISLNKDSKNPMQAELIDHINSTEYIKSINQLWLTIFDDSK